MFVLIFIAVVSGQDYNRIQSFSSMNDCQIVKRSIQTEFRGKSNVKIKKLVCETKKK